jgi:hypothetical protein
MSVEHGGYIRRGFDLATELVIGGGARGGTLSKELTQRGASVVCLEAGPRLTLSVNDNATMFGRLSWLDKRIGTGDLNPGLPLWVCKTVGGTTVHWAGRIVAFPRPPISTSAPSTAISPEQICSTGCPELVFRFELGWRPFLGVDNLAKLHRVLEIVVLGAGEVQRIVVVEDQQDRRLPLPRGNLHLALAGVDLLANALADRAAMHYVIDPRALGHDLLDLEHDLNAAKGHAIVRSLARPTGMECRAPI